jgi:hypothetical protein
VIGSWQQESVYVVTAVAEYLALRASRNSFGALAVSVRLYLRAQLAMFFVLMPLSLFSACRWYLPVWMLCSAANFVAEMCVLLGLFQELSPDARVYGTVKLWMVSCLVVGTIVSAVIVLEPPKSLSWLGRVYLSIDQAFTIFRNTGLFAVFFKGYLCGSSWPTRVTMVWGGMAFYSICDFTSQRLEVIHSFSFNPILKYVPAIATLIMFGLWAMALNPRRVLGIVFAPQEK